MYIFMKIVLMLTLLFTGLGSAQVTPLHPSIQAILFSKIFSYVRTIDNLDSMKLFIVSYDEAEAEEMIDAFRDEGVEAVFLQPAELEQNPVSNAVVYVLPDVSASFTSALFKKNKLLSISGAPQLAVDGTVSIAVGFEAGHSKIIINTTKLEEESHRVSHELLNLSTVIR